MSRYLPLLCLCFSSWVFAHAGESSESSDELIDCENPPAKLKNTLPGKLSEVASLMCTPSVQMIVAKEGWTWRFPGSYFDRPSIPAFSPSESRSNPTGRFFVRFKERELKPAEIAERHQAFRKLPTYKETSPPKQMIKLIATNDQGHLLDAYFGLVDGKHGWVVVCVPECAPEYLFLMQKLE
jgi:hypothetical protein